jgi:predicted RNA binding protein YcfA (HicA-like mRNA interferase family)
VTKLIPIDAAKMERLLFKLGFKKVRQRGSHAFYRHPDGRYTTVPHHRGRMLARPLIREILKEIKVDVEEYGKYLQEL